MNAVETGDQCVAAGCRLHLSCCALCPRAAGWQSGPVIGARHRQSCPAEMASQSSSVCVCVCVYGWVWEGLDAIWNGTGGGGGGVLLALFDEADNLEHNRKKALSWDGERPTGVSAPQTRAKGWTWWTTVTHGYLLLRTFPALFVTIDYLVI